MKIIYDIKASAPDGERWPIPRVIVFCCQGMSTGYTKHGAEFMAALKKGGNIRYCPYCGERVKYVRGTKRIIDLFNQEEG